MVEYSLQLDLVFHSLSDATRRDILKRVAREDQPIKALVAHYSLTFAGIAKHIHILEKADLVRKRKHGREQIVSANPQAIHLSQKHLEQYQKIINCRYDQLDQLLHTM